MGPKTPNSYILVESLLVQSFAHVILGIVHKYNQTIFPLQGRLLDMVANYSGNVTSWPIKGSGAPIALNGGEGPG